MNRAESLHQIITFGKQRDEAFMSLVKLGYDHDAEPFSLTTAVLTEVLSLYMADAISADDLEEWANFVETRDDINGQAIEGYIYALAEPEVMGDITKNNIRQMLTVLQASN